MSSANTQWWSITPAALGGNIISTSTSSTTAEALSNGQGRYMFAAITSNAYVRLGTFSVSAAAATDANFDFVVLAGTYLVITTNPSVTHFRVIADASGTLVVNKVGN